MSRDLYGGRGLALQPWQRTNVLAAATYLREQLAKTPDDLRCRSMYEGLLDVLDPARRAGRAQRELAEAAKSAAATLRRERRRERDRRAGGDRRERAEGPRAGVERRVIPDRRSGRDRRRH
jgi:hypothetical protein